MNKLILFLTIALSLSFFSFKDNTVPKYKSIGHNLILRNDGAKYQKGLVNLKFKEQIYSFNKLKFGIPKLDNLISQFDITDVRHIYPLKKDISKRVIGDEELAKIFSFRYSGSIDPTELSEMIMEINSDIIEWAEPDFVYEMDYIPNDPNMNQQYHITKIVCPQAWDITKGDTSVVIGIVDSGSDLDHPDLAANIKYNYNDPINNIDDDNNGFVDDFAGWDFYYADNDPNIHGGSDHGSHVSGCASQVTDNGIHGAGPGFKVKLRITKHAPDTPDNLIYYSNEGIVYMYQNNVKIINCSFGSGTYSSYTQSIVTSAWNAGTVICASAGNGEPGYETPRYPASYDNVVSVAATNENDIKAIFSCYHSTVDVSAPGQSILSTVYDNSYTHYSGTSMSSPITAGTVGLIRSRYPSWTPAQVVERLKLGVDSIYNLNPTYVGKLGTGRINAFKCVSDYPLVALQNYSHNDSVYGNNDKVYDIGEKIPILITFKNIWLTGNDVSLRLTTDDPDIELVKDSVYIGTLNEYVTYSTSLSNTFEVKAKPTCPFDNTVTFKLRTSSHAYPNESTNDIVIKFRQGWATHDINNLIMSLTKDGAVGKKTEGYGSGLYLSGSPNIAQMVEGGLMIGVSSTKVSDVCRRGQSPATISDTDFVGLSSYIINTPGVLSGQDGKGLFNDDGAGSNKIGVTVRPQSYAWNTAQDENYILLRYIIKNTSGSAIANMFAGIYIYFKPGGSTSNNITAVNSQNKVGYTYSSSSQNPYLGVALLTDHNLNFKAVNALEVLTGFTTQEKWDALSNGIAADSIGPGLNCMVISAGPLNLNAGDSVTVGFAVVKGSSLGDLITNTVRAKFKYSVIGVKKISTLIPRKYELYQNYPNPFNPVTKIKFDLPKQDEVTIKVFDILGRKAAAILEGEKLAAGSYEFGFDASNLSSGIYFYRIQTASFSAVKKMVLIK
jgi:serine protease